MGNTRSIKIMTRTLGVPHKLLLISSTFSSKKGGERHLSRALPCIKQLIWQCIVMLVKVVSV